MAALTLSKKEEKRLEKKRQVLQVFLGNLISQIPSHLYKCNEVDLNKVLKNATEALPKESPLRKILEQDIEYAILFLKTKLEGSALQKEIEKNPVICSLFHHDPCSIPSVQQLCALIRSNSPNPMTKADSVLAALRSNSLIEPSDLSAYSHVLCQCIKGKSQNDDRKKMRKIVLSFISSYILLMSKQSQNQLFPHNLIDIDPIFNVIAWYLFSFPYKKKNKQESRTKMSIFLSPLLTSRSFAAKLTIACSTQYDFSLSESQSPQCGKLVFNVLSECLLNTNMAQANELPSTFLVHDLDELWRLLKEWAGEVLKKKYSTLSWNSLDVEHEDDLVNKNQIEMNETLDETKEHIEEDDKSEIKDESIDAEEKVEYKEKRNDDAAVELEQETEQKDISVLEDEVLDVKNKADTDAVEKENDAYGESNETNNERHVESKEDEVQPEPRSTRRNSRKSLKAKEVLEASNSTTMKTRKKRDKKPINVQDDQHDKKENNIDHELIDENKGTREDILVCATKNNEDQASSKDETQVKKASNKNTVKSRTSQRSLKKSVKALESSDDLKSEQPVAKAKKTTRSRSKRSVLPNIPEVAESAPPVESIMMVEEPVGRKRKSMIISSAYSDQSEDSSVSEKVSRSSRRRRSASSNGDQSNDDESVNSIASNSSVRRTSRRKKSDSAKETDDISVNSVTSNSSVRRSGRIRKADTAKDNTNENVSVTSMTSNSSVRRSSRRRKAVQRD